MGGTLRTLGLICAKDRAEVAVRQLDRDFAVLWHAAALPTSRELVTWKRVSTIMLHWDSVPSDFAPFMEGLGRVDPQPAVVFAGPLNSRGAFALAAAGVDAYFESIDTFGVADFDVLPKRGEEILLEVSRRIVGRVGVKEAQRALRVGMFREALQLESGNRHAAARLLGVDRRYVLKMLKELTVVSAVPNPNASIKRWTEVRTRSTQ